MAQMRSPSFPRHVIVEPDEDGGYHVYCPSLPGCNSQGETVEEALANIKEAIELYIGVLDEDGLPVPQDHLDRLLVAVL